MIKDRDFELENMLNIYEDKNHVRYIAFNELQFSPNELKWFHDMQESFSLEELVKKFPYVVLIYDEKTGNITEKEPCKYNAKLTNNFHILYAKYLDNKDYKIDLSSIYNNDTNKKESYDIGFKEENIIQDPNEGIAINNDIIPDKIEIKPLPKNYHPNKNSNGDYMAGPIQNYVNGYVYNPANSYIPNAYPNYISAYRTYNIDPTDINRHIIRF